MSIYLSIYLSLSISIYLYLSIYLSIYPSIYLCTMFITIYLCKYHVMSYTDLTKVLTRPLFQHLYAPTPCSPLHLATLYTSICSTFCFFTIALHCTYSQVVQYIQYSTFSSTTNPVPVPPSFTSARVTMKATREREMKDLLHHSCENHNIITSCSTFLIYYIIVSSGAPLFVNFVLINLSLIVTYNLLCCI